jgi:nucleotide-binding universal stress UspA family protein
MSSNDSTGPIVVPLDGSKNAENALPFAALLAQLHGATVEFVHVVDHEGVEGQVDLAQSRETFTTYAGQLADQWAIAKYRSLVPQGSPAAMILEAASAASFIVIASHGHGGFHAMFIGSVADKVVRGATVPVLLVPGVGAPVFPDTHRTILIGLDGSEPAENALRVGRSLATKMGAPIVLIRAWMLPAQAMATYGAEGGYYPADELLEMVTATANEYLQHTAVAGEKAFVAQGSPALVLAAAATQLDAGLVVVAASGQGLAARFALGSTTDRLMHSLHRPLLIVPA